jgi:hypothetical protein
MPVPSHEVDFQRYMPWYCFVFSELRRELVVHFVDIGGIVDNHCLNCLFLFGLIIPS